MRILDLLSEEKAAIPPKPRNFVAKNAKMGGAGQHKDKKKAEKQGDVKHKKDLATMESQGVAEGSDDKFSVADKVEQLVDQYRLYDKRGWTDLFAKLAGRKLEVAEIRREMEYASKFLQLLDSIRMRSDYRGQQDPRKDQELIALSNQWLDLFNKATTEFKGMSGQGVAEAVEDRTSYQVAKVLHDHGIKYDPAREDELVQVIGLALVKELNMSPKQARGVMNSEDFLGDTFGELQHMSQGVEEAGYNHGFGDPRAPKLGSYQRDMDDEANVMYIYDTNDGRLKQKMVSNPDRRSAEQAGFKDQPEQALRAHNIIRSKFDPKKYVQNQGGKWVTVYPYGQKTEGVAEGLDYNKRQQLIKFLAKKLDWDASHLELATDAELVTWYKNVQAGKKPMGY